MTDNDLYVLIGMLRRYSYQSTSPQDIENIIDGIVTGMDE